MAADWAVTWLPRGADVDKSQIWAVRFGSDGPDQIVPFHPILLILAVKIGSDGSPRSDRKRAAPVAGIVEDGGAPLGCGRR